ncbi:MAG: RNHCP domain-containing protein [bacterium]|nr:RNHCP domain-containing protein [bacterium]
MFKENNGFTCAGCGIDVLPAKKTSRNHCPQCFLSLHVDLAEP